MAKAKTYLEDALIKAAVTDLTTTEGRAARDALKNKFNEAKPSEIKQKCILSLRQAAESKTIGRVTRKRSRTTPSRGRRSASRWRDDDGDAAELGSHRAAAGEAVAASVDVGAAEVTPRDRC